MFSKTRNYKLCVYVPTSHVEEVKNAIFGAGAGKIGNYDYCSWQTLGSGQFRPLENSNPTLGKHHHLEQVAEYKVELLCAGKNLAAVLVALKQAHPYEEPNYDVRPLLLSAGK